MQTGKSNISSIQAAGKENRPPKINLKVDFIEGKRSSVPRIEGKLKLGFKKQTSMSKKNLRSKKNNNSKVFVKNGNTFCDANNSCVFGLNQSRVKITQNKSEIKQFQTKAEEDKKIEKELQNMYLILVNTKFMSDLESEDTLESKTAKRSKKQEQDTNKTYAEDEILTYRFEKSGASNALLSNEDSIVKNQSNVGRVDRFQNR